MVWIALAAGTLAAGLSMLMLAYGPRLGYSLREPTDEEREHLLELRERVGGPEVPVAIRITSHGEAVGTTLLGLPGRRQLVVSDAALDHLSDDQLGALLAVEAERGRAMIAVTQALSTGVAIAIVTAAYVTPIEFLTAMIAGWAVVLAGIALVRRRHYQVDRAVAEAVGRETLRDALAWAAEVRGDSLEPGRRWRALIEVEPSVGARLERLR